MGYDMPPSSSSSPSLLPPPTFPPPPSSHPPSSFPPPSSLPQLSILNTTVGLLRKYLPNKVVYPAVGNHESSPVNRCLSNGFFLHSPHHHPPFPPHPPSPPPSAPHPPSPPLPLIQLPSSIHHWKPVQPMAVGCLC